MPAVLPTPPRRIRQSPVIHLLSPWIIVAGASFEQRACLGRHRCNRRVCHCGRRVAIARDEAAWRSGRNSPRARRCRSRAPCYFESQIFAGLAVHGPGIFQFADHALVGRGERGWAGIGLAHVHCERCCRPHFSTRAGRRAAMADGVFCSRWSGVSGKVRHATSICFGIALVQRRFSLPADLIGEF